MSATDELRRLLDEQNPLRMRWCVPTGGNPSLDTNVINDDFGVFHFSEDPECGLDLNGVTLFHFLTPEQAIEATLGRGTCHVDVLNTGDCAGYECSEYIMHCNGCGHEFGHVLYNEDGDVWMSEPPNYCPNCGRKVEQ